MTAFAWFAPLADVSVEALAEGPRQRLLHGFRYPGWHVDGRAGLDEMFRALSVLTSDPGLVAITLTEVNPHNAAADDGLLERFAASFADVLGQLPSPKTASNGPRGRSDPWP